MNLMRQKLSGFTMIELMVAMVVIMAGIASFFGLSNLMIKGNRKAQMNNESVSLLNNAFEPYTAIAWNDLGTDTALPSSNGLANAAILSLGPINRKGEELGVGEGPYKYFRHMVVCTQSDATTPGANPEYCTGIISPSTRPTELSCSPLSLGADEKMIRIVVAMRVRSGKCLTRSIDSLRVQ
ncbi:MAG: type II secretion system protein [Bdellovibrionales bacterium]|nr:type II secretion system protein [Bdellovibrionales bacterium]